MITTGLKSLDDCLAGLRKGDNVVWQIEHIGDYESFCLPFVKKALEEGKKVIYIRFASHRPLFKTKKGIRVYHLDASGGFESFATEVNAIITREGRGAYYVFDCLTDLLPAWATDLMIGNFFAVTCPYLFELDTIAYFALLRDNHSFKTIARIRETTQLLIDVYHCDDICYIHPLKVWNRYSPTMFLPHLKQGGDFLPVTDSAHAARLLSHITQRKAEDTKRNLDYWDRLFLDAEEVLQKKATKKEKEKMFEYLSRISVTRDEKIRALVKKHFALEDLIPIKARIIGTGLIGGKAVGMLLSRKILAKEGPLHWQKLSEDHDSFYIGSDVFYTYIVENGWWGLRMEQKTEEGYFEVARILREKILFGKFSEEVMEQFQQMIEYFGTSPIIVRSSSLLEDGFGNAFAGKYESIFCANQGTPEERYIKFAEAVRRIYASAMSEEALNYRLQRGLAKRDEQMALLVQRVSGAYHGNYFFPDMAGVGVSYNTYVWNEKMDARQGMVRLVAGLGTRAVNRVEGDYARIVALDEPLLRPYSDIHDIRKFSQHDVDIIDVKNRELCTKPFSELIAQQIDLPLEHIAVRDEEIIRQAEERGIRNKESWIITFDDLLSHSPLVKIFKKILKVLERHYHYPVDIEFTVNFGRKKDFKINLLQCRPLQTHGLGERVEIPEKIPAENILLETKGYFLGGSISEPIRRILYVRPQGYADLTQQEKFEVARIIGALNKEIKSKENTPTLLLGPGRWGTSTPSLGVPVSFFELNRMAVLGEIAFEGGNLMPELSFGTHFFQDLVESGIFYFALFPGQEGVVFNELWLGTLENLLEKLMPQYARFKGVVGVYDVSDKNLKIVADIVSQRAVCFLE